MHYNLSMKTETNETDVTIEIDLNAYAEWDRALVESKIKSAIDLLESLGYSVIKLDKVG